MRLTGGIHSTKNEHQVWFNFSICSRVRLTARVFMSNARYEQEIHKVWPKYRGDIGPAVTLFGEDWIECWFTRDTVCMEFVTHELGHVAWQYVRRFPDPVKKRTREEYYCGLLGMMSDKFFGKFGRYFAITSP